MAAGIYFILFLISTYVYVYKKREEEIEQDEIIKRKKEAKWDKKKSFTSINRVNSLKIPSIIEKNPTEGIINLFKLY